VARRLISLDDFDDMEIDVDTRQIFWRGQEIVTTMRLPWWVNVAAVVAAFSTLGLFIEGLIPLLK
jgi:hypothetical protein